MGLGFEALSVGLLETNCYLIWDELSSQALILDPGDEAMRIARRARELGLSVVAVAITHGHVDHAGAAGSLAELFGVPVLVHPADLDLLQAMPFQASMFGLPEPDPIPETAPLRDGDRVVLGRSVLEVRHTPGHSAGSVSLLSQDGRKAWVGDLIFQGAVGRTDLPGGSVAALRDSLRSVILSLPDDWVLCPGHGPLTTVGEERSANPFVHELGG
ncbi:MAG: MBL fold metallo-hydrolase [candidate division KSB1 bacterium]|nr:MBL fold metallo-hydrolase [candidate division KSB1 bacterium]